MIKLAKEIHRSILTMDTHVDINTKNFTKTRNYTQDIDTQVNIPKMIKGGLDAVWLIVYTGQGAFNKEGYKAAYKNAIDKFEAIHRLIELYAPNDITLALNANDVKRIYASGKKAVMIGVENAYSLGLNLENIEVFYNLGARYMSLAHQGHNQFSDSNTGEKDKLWFYHNGLSNAGKKAIKEMNRLGMMIDVSHPSSGAFYEIIKLSRAPIIASHSSARAICNHSRNLDDDQLLLLKKNGGLVQTVAFSSYLNIDKDEAYKKAKEKIYNKIGKTYNFKIIDRNTRKNWSAKANNTYLDQFKLVQEKSQALLAAAEKITPPVDVSDFVDHIDYLVKLIGIEHVGISSDFDGGGGVKGWNDASETFNVTYELVKRGYNKTQISKLWGLNLLRVLEEVQSLAIN